MQLTRVWAGPPAIGPGAWLTSLTALQAFLGSALHASESPSHAPQVTDSDCPVSRAASLGMYRTPLVSLGDSQISFLREALEHEPAYSALSPLGIFGGSIILLDLHFICKKIWISLLCIFKALQNC